jgi:hypothetical protein
LVRTFQEVVIMSTRQGESRTIHPTAIAKLGYEACIVALGVARDLRSGVIPPEEYNQVNLGEFSPCPCCIAGHIGRRMGVWPSRISMRLGLLGQVGYGLFSGGNPSDPQLAADAIERCIYDGSDTPWKA